MYMWTKSKKKNVVIFWIILFLVLCYVMYCSPFVSDDLEFKKLNLFSIKDNIHHSLYYGNGRFLGNLGSVLLVNHKILSCVVRAFIISVLCILIPKNCNCNTEVSYIFSTILIVGIQPELFGEIDEQTGRRSASAVRVGSIVYEYRESAIPVPEDVAEQASLARQLLDVRKLTKKERKTYDLELPGEQEEP